MNIQNNRQGGYRIWLVLVSAELVSTANLDALHRLGHIIIRFGPASSEQVATAGCEGNAASGARGRSTVDLSIQNSCMRRQLIAIARTECSRSCYCFPNIHMIRTATGCRKLPGGVVNLASAKPAEARTRVRGDLLLCQYYPADQLRGARRSLARVGSPEFNLSEAPLGGCL